MACVVAVEASAPGKLILFGEHAVVYGATAVAGALSDLRIFSRVVGFDARASVA
jgi:mevalonate kinase